MDAQRPTAQSIAIRGDRIVWVGSNDRSEWRGVRSEIGTGHGSLSSFFSIHSSTRVIDCGGGTLIPGFHDAHAHLLAYASSLDAVDCRPSQVSSIADIEREVASRAARTPRGKWVSAWGYDPASLAERRHPTRWELDRAAPDHPVRLSHRSGHACVLNSLAMERVGIVDNTDEPPGATIARDLDTGNPNGLLMEMEGFLDGRIPRPSTAELSASVERAALKLLSLGVTSVQDATHNNSIDRWNLFQRLSGLGAYLPRITLMPGAGHVADFADAGLGFGSGPRVASGELIVDSGLHSPLPTAHYPLRVGHAKLMVTASSGAPTLSFAELKAAIDRCVSLGFPVAVHAVEADVVRAAARAFAEARRLPASFPKHRIEHCSEAPPDALELIAENGAVVVTQPGFIRYQGDRYLDEVSPAMQPYLYRAASLAERGVRVAFSSDAPVSEPNPMPALHAAVTRRTESGNVVGGHEAMDLDAALRSYTLEPARATGEEGRLGRLTAGSVADLALFEEDLLDVAPETLPGIRPVMTVLGGQIVWES